MKTTSDTLGDRLKRLENDEGRRAGVKGFPLLARLDGRAFHTFTKGLKRPFDERLSDMMVKATATLVHELGDMLRQIIHGSAWRAWTAPISCFAPLKPSKIRRCVASDMSSVRE